MAHRGLISPVPTDNASITDKGPTAGPLSLKEIGEQQRLNIVRFNEYKENQADRYSPQHPNAQSDGDEHGRGEITPGQVGTNVDISTRNQLQFNSGNKFNPNNLYGC